MNEVNFDTFCEETGVLSPKQVKKQVSAKLLKSLKPLVSIQDDYMMAWEACGSSLLILKEIINTNPNLYIGTQVDGDNGDIFYENECAFVNRNVYFLCSKNQGNLFIAGDS